MKIFSTPKHEGPPPLVFRCIVCNNITISPLISQVRCFSLMRCKRPLDSSLCPLDKRFLHSYGSYDSTTITRGLLPTRQAIKFLSLLNEMQKSTRQFTLSSGQALSPLVRLVRLDYHYTGSLTNKTSDKISKSP